MSDLNIRGVHANVARDDRGARLDYVRLWGVATWLKREPIVTADLTPAEARKLAKRLLVAADQAEGDAS